MATTFSSVRPGDIISSDLMNFVFDRITDLEQRVAQLESGAVSGGQVRIDHFDPPNQVAAGQLLSVFGANFAFPPTNNQVMLDDTTIVAFEPDSTDSMLKFVVPTSLNIPNGGRNVKITITNSKGTGSALYRILPAVSAPGNPPLITDVVPVSGNLIQVNQPIRIVGQNFAANPADDIVTFQIMTANGPHVYPGTQINTAQSNTIQIIVTVPDITEIVTGQGTFPVTLRVTVGAQVPASRNILVMRP